MIGRIISHYRIIEKLGEGGMGVVYKAEDTRLNRIVALKFLPPELTRDPESKQRFAREARAASALDHPNICTIFDVDETENGEMFISMACYEGETLSRKIERGRLEPQEACRIAMQVAGGLAKAHGQGIIHRDIKPANIFVTLDGQVKIVDFGLARLSRQTVLTRPGMTPGTAAYMSPEQVRGQSTDHRTDIWSLGVTLYEALAGRPPFKGEYEMSIMYSIVNENPAPLSSVSPGVTPQLELIVNRAMKKSVDERYRSATELIKDLAWVLGVPEPGLVYGTALPGASSVAKPGASMAVLPFVNLSADQEQDYFCDGMAENLISALAQVRGLRVVARTSAFSFRGKNVDVREIGAKLNVESLLEGSVQKVGDRLRVTVQLVNVVDGYQLWSEKYDRNLDDIFAVQDEISQAVVDRLKIQVHEPERLRLKRHHTENARAYNLYLKGRWFIEKYTEEALNKAVKYFESAIDLDPQFALAIAGLADAYATLGITGYLPQEVAYARSAAQATKAVEIDDALPEAHLALANVRLWADWDWEAAEREFKTALKLNPANAEVLHQYAHMMIYLGRSDEAVTTMKRSIELEPISVLMNSCLGQILYFARKFDEAIDQLEKTIEMDPHFHSPYIWLALAYAQKGTYAKAIEAVREHLSHPTGGTGMTAALGYIYALAGRTGEAKEINAQLENLSNSGSATPYYVARIYAGMNDAERSIEWLRKCFAKREASLTFLNTDPVWDKLRGDPRFIDLLNNLGRKK